MIIALAMFIPSSACTKLDDHNSPTDVTAAVAVVKAGIESIDILELVRLWCASLCAYSICLEFHTTLLQKVATTCSQDFHKLSKS